MSWVSARRAYLIGAGALLVAAVAIGVAIGAAAGGSVHRTVVAKGPLVGGRVLPGPFGGRALRGDPFAGRAPIAPRLLRRGSPLSPAIAPLPFGGDVLHGQVTVRNPNGGNELIDLQRGTVTKVGSGSITVRSSDGFTATYAASASLLNGVHTGEGVLLRATVSGAKATVRVLEVVPRVSSAPAARPSPVGTS